jgi:predicted Zn finger-like uncharacterized protein
MKIVCDACSAKYSIADEKVAGKVFKIRCKKCSNIIVVRGVTAEEPAAQPQQQFDQKETKVFDYSGYDNPSEAAAAGEDEGEWHVVIDQEQVGPLTPEEVQRKFVSGEIDADTYTGKEGFGDWERLADIEMFAGMVAAGGPTVDAPAGGDDVGGLFGGPSSDDTAQSDPADLFSAATGDADDPGNDLFGGGGGLGDSLSSNLAAASATDDGGGASAGLFGASEPEPDDDAEQQLKGQRNENSVLFSLGNLASLASDAPKSSPSPSAPSQPGMAQASGSEGSGLIDIRSMAQVYLGDKPDAGGGSSIGTGSADDLPVFSQSSFEAASPVLMPTASAGGDNRLLIMLGSAIALLIVVAVILIIVVVKGGDKETVAAASPTDGDDTDVAASDKDDKDTADTPDTPETPPPADPATATDTPPAADPPPTTPGAAVGKPDPRKGKDRAKDRNRDRNKDRNKPTSTDRKPPKPKNDPIGSATSGKGCDEVTCLVEPDKACCKKYSRGGGGGGGGGGGSDSNLPERLSRSDISKGISKVRGRVMSCGDKHGGKGKVSVKIKISGGGKVTSASASGAGSGSLRNCVSGAVRKAKFRKTQRGMSVNYPFVFR